MMSDETRFIINPMGSDYYDQDILIQVRNKTGRICLGKLLSGSMHIEERACLLLWLVITFKLCLIQYMAHSN